MKLKLDNGFLSFIKTDGKNKPLVWGILLVGALLILLGVSTPTAQSTNTERDTAETLAEICSLAEGVGECEVMLTYGDGGEVVAALVLCEGASSPSVRARVVSMVSTLFGIGTHRIEVVKISK